MERVVQTLAALAVAFAASALALTPTANAADFPVKAPTAVAYAPVPFTWTGWELGVGVTGVWDTYNLLNGFGQTAGSVKPSSVRIEGLSLINYEFANHFVVGHKFKFGYENPSILGQDAATWRGETGPLVGYDFGPLLYVSGGLEAQTTTLNFLNGTSSPALGWYIGPGIEFRPFGTALVIGADVNYVNNNGVNVPGVFKITNTAVEFGGHVGWLFQ